MSDKKPAGVLSVTDFRQGIDTASPSLSMRPGAADDCLNVIGHPDGSLRVRNGTKQVSTDTFPSTLSSPGAVHIGGSPPQRVHYVAATSTALYAGRPGSGGTDKFQTVASYAGGASSNMPMLTGTYQYFGGYHLWWNQNKMYVLTPGSPWTLTDKTQTGYPRASLSTVHHNLLFLAGNDTYPMRVQYCMPASATSPINDAAPTTPWPASYTFQINEPKGGWLTGLVSHQGQMYAATPQGVVMVSGYDWAGLSDVAQVQLPVRSGCVAPRSFRSAPFGLVYVGWNGLYILRGASAERVSDAVWPLVRRGGSRDLTYSTVHVTEHLVIWSVPSVADPWTPDLCLVFDVRTKSWWRWDLGCRLFWPTVRDSQGMVDFAFLRASDGRIVEYGPEFLGDDAVPFQWQWTSGMMPAAGSVVSRGRLERATVAFSQVGSSVVTLDAWWDRQRWVRTGKPTFNFVQQAATGPYDWNEQVVRMGALGSGRLVQLVLSGQASAPLCVHGLQADVAVLPE